MKKAFRKLRESTNGAPTSYTVDEQESAGREMATFGWFVKLNLAAIIFVHRLRILRNRLGVEGLW